MNILIAPDSFKGTLTAVQVCDIVAAAIQKHCPGATITSLPVADGGEGTIDCLARSGNGDLVTIATTGPYGEPINAHYLRLPDGTAVIETAATAGLSLVRGREDPSYTTTAGMAAQVLHACANQAKRIVFALGGSCTNDGGCGLLSGLGVRFYDSAGRIIMPTGATLTDISRIDSTLSPVLDNVVFSAMCDVTNPFYGSNGAAYVYARQKGADDAMIERLDDGMSHLAHIIQHDVGIDLQSIAGSGAAGGLGGGIAALLGGSLRSGIDTVLDLTDFDEKTAAADYIISGEGCVDEQTIQGKVVAGIARRCGGKPLIVLCGLCERPPRELYDMGVTAIIPVNRVRADMDTITKTCFASLSDTADMMCRMLLHGNI